MTDQVESTLFTPETEAPVAPVETAPVQDPVPAAPAFQVPDSVKELVGEGKKYSTVADALSALPFAQSHIEKLEDEMASLREQAAKQKAMEDVLEEINKKPTEPAPAPQDPAQLDALIDERLTAKEMQAQKAMNSRSVATRLIEEYGSEEKAKEFYEKRARELNLPVSHVDNLSATSPDAVFQLFGLMRADQSVQKIHSNVNSEAIHQTPNQEPVKPKSVMGRSTHQDDIAAWKACATE